MLSIDLSRQARKFLAGIGGKQQKQILAKLDELANFPFHPASIQLKGEFSKFRRMKSGEYRIVYHFNDSVLFATIIAKRNDDEVYNLLKRLNN